MFHTLLRCSLRTGRHVTCTPTSRGRSHMHWRHTWLHRPLDAKAHPVEILIEGRVQHEARLQLVVQGSVLQLRGRHAPRIHLHKAHAVFLVSVTMLCSGGLDPNVGIRGVVKRSTRRACSTSAATQAHSHSAGIMRKSPLVDTGGLQCRGANHGRAGQRHHDHTLTGASASTGSTLTQGREHERRLSSSR